MDVKITQPERPLTPFGALARTRMFPLSHEGRGDSARLFSGVDAALRFPSPLVGEGRGYVQ